MIDLDHPDLDRVDAILREVARTEILPRFRRLAAHEVREKSGPTDLVTVADEASERELSSALSRLLPGSVVVGEEATAADPTVLDRLDGDQPVWVIDPIDGTINFAQGRPQFAVIVAYARGGETLAGWIHDPCGGRTAMAAKGRGAWMEGRRLTVAPPAPLSALSGALSTRFCDEPLESRLKARIKDLGGSHCLACAAHEYLSLLEGRTQVSLYNRLMPWDHAAGVLLHAEAGGWGGLVDGAPYRPTSREGALLNAPDLATWRLLRDHLFGEG